jgi:homeobox-leucine zipper protein
MIHPFPAAWQVLRLKERLGATEEELRRVRSAAGSNAASGDGGDAAGTIGVCGGSPSSSFSTGTCHQQHPGFSGADVLEPDNDLMMCAPEYGGYADSSVVEWFSLYGLM